MAPSKKRSVLERKADHVSRRAPAGCACLQKPRSDGVCALNVWQGTMIDAQAAQSEERLLRPHLPVVKYKEWTLFGLSGHLYHLVILGWVQLLCLFVALYIFVVGVFAFFFAACNGIDYPTRHAEVRYYFNLSLQTLATIGYGHLYPRNACSNWISVIEAFVSMLLMSFMTGVAFVKFARPKPNIIFSKVFTVSERESGGLEMRFRVVNGTRREVISRGEILEVSFKLILMRVERTRNGEKKLCYYDLPLKTSSFITLRLEAELVHRIDRTSPFHGLNQTEIKSSDFVLILMMAGVDQNLHDMIHKQHEYDYKSMQWAAKFERMMDWCPMHQCLDLDFAKVSAVLPQPFQRSYSIVEIGDETESVEDGEEASAWNVEDSMHEVDLNQLHFETALSSSQRTKPLQRAKSERATSREASEFESLNDLDEGLANDEDDDETKSQTSTKTNSDSEGVEKYAAPAQYRLRFDHRSRSTNFQMPRFTRHIHSHESPESSFDQPASMAQRKVRFKNHPMSRFSKGLYYRALETSWVQFLLWLVVVYFAVISITASFMYMTPGQAVIQSEDIHFGSEYERLFFFCAQTISTIGYGSLSPNPDNNVVNFFVFVLVFAGAVVSTLLTGLTWAKFSIPKASTVLFSDNLLLTAFHGSRSLVFRAANNRTFGMIIEGSFRYAVKSC
ncbi:Inward rectifier potassium channel 4 [Globisporangium polare]